MQVQLQDVHLRRLFDELHSRCLILETARFYLPAHQMRIESKLSSVFFFIPSSFLTSAKNQADRQAEVREIKRRLTRKVR